eukprot:12698361-Heterocapsa_arctica.AAC.1
MRTLGRAAEGPENEQRLPWWARVITGERRVISYDILLGNHGSQAVSSTFVVTDAQKMRLSL